MRKRSTLFAVLSCLFPQFLLAQPEVEVEEGSADFDGDKRPAVRIMVYGETQDEVEKKARKTFRGWGNVNSRSNPLHVEGAEWSDLGDHPFDLYLKVEEQDDSTQVVLASAYLGGAWLNSGDHGDRYEAFSERIREFAVRVTKEAMEKIVEKREEQLEEVQDRNEEIKDNIEDLEKDIEDHKSDIEDWKEEIEEAQKAIEKVNSEVEELKKKQEAQKEKLKAQQQKVEKAQKKKDAVD